VNVIRSAGRGVGVDEKQGAHHGGRPYIFLLRSRQNGDTRPPGGA
jgi:hypothetical protein